MIRIRQFLYLFPLIGILIFSGPGCKKNDGLDTSPSAYLTFSTTLVEFDTVFASTGSSTHNFTVHNPNKQAVNISDIRLQGGISSPFRVNINGNPTTDFPNVRLAAGDSIFIFAEVTINPTNANLPFIVTDTILFVLNGHTQKVALQAYGQNAHFINNRILGCDTTFHNDGIPIVLYDTAYVNPKCTLTIDAGVTIYCHHNAVFLIDGTMISNGTKAQPVIFRQDRLEQSYENQPGQWFGIRFLDSSINNTLTHTIIEEATAGIEVDSFPYAGQAKLSLSKCIIKNCSSEGLICFGASVNATNSLIYASGMYNVYCALGGTYNFINCTFDIINDFVANRVPSIHLDNEVYKSTAGVLSPLDLKANFYNCIIWGDLADEVDLQKYTGDAFDTTFRHNIIKAKKLKFGSLNQVSQNQYYPGFVNEAGGDYHLIAGSPAINGGTLAVIPGIPPFNDDLDDVHRPNPITPDIGCYTYH
jgi:hypothetical protein